MCTYKQSHDNLQPSLFAYLSGRAESDHGWEISVERTVNAGLVTTPSPASGIAALTFETIDLASRLMLRLFKVVRAVAMVLREGCERCGQNVHHNLAMSRAVLLAV